MANAAYVEYPLFVDFTIDSDAVATPINITCNRNFRLLDYNVAVITGSGTNDGNETAIVFAQHSSTGVFVQTEGFCSSWAALANTYVRPTVCPTVPVIGTTNLRAASSIGRGGILRITTSSAGTGVATAVRGSGVLKITTGNRYATGRGTDYPNNSTTGAQGTGATQNI